MANQQFESCIEACNTCADACDHCAASCLQEADVKAMAHCIALDMDCAQVCRLAAGYMARDSEFASALCQTCADDCQACAQACRSCADQCHRMAGAASGAQHGTGAAATAH